MTTKNDDARAARLKAALRENLRRRKLQVRGRGEADAHGAPAEDAGEGPGERETPRSEDGQTG